MSKKIVIYFKEILISFAYTSCMEMYMNHYTKYKEKVDYMMQIINQVIFTFITSHRAYMHESQKSKFYAVKSLIQSQKSKQTFLNMTRYTFTLISKTKHKNIKYLKITLTQKQRC